MELNNLKVLGVNVASWLGTIFSMQDALQAMQLVCLIGSFAVSAASVWWVVRQNKNAEEAKRLKDLPKDL